jgi:hypothetical protein
MTNLFVYQKSIQLMYIRTSSRVKRSTLEAALGVDSSFVSCP